MFQFKNGRLYPRVTPRKLSFKLPEGFWICTYAEDYSCYSISFFTEERNATVEVSIGTSDYFDTAQEAVDMFEGTPAEELDGPYPVTAGEFTGHGIYCCTNAPQYAAFLDVGEHSVLGVLTEEEEDAGEDDWFRRVMVVIDVEDQRSVKENLKALKKAVQDKGVVELMNSFRIEK